MNAALLMLRARGLWSRGREQFNRRPTRERLLLIGACCALIVLGADRLWLEPGFKRWRAAAQAEHQAQELLAQAQAEAARLEAQRQDGAQSLQRQLRELQQRAQRRQAEPGASTLVPAQQMLPLLEQLLRQHGQLRLKGLASLGKLELPGGIYRHGVELNVEGSYAELLAYLQELEALPEQLLWGQLQLKVEQYPRVQLMLRVYTLSTDLDWFKL